MEDSRRAAVKQKIGRLRRSGKINDAQSAILEIIGKYDKHGTTNKHI